MDKTTKQLIPFIVASFLLFFSVLFGPKAMGVGLIIWILVLAITMSKMLFKNYSIPRFFADIDRKSSNLLKDRKYVEGSVYVITTPLVIMGIAVLFLIVIMLFSI